MKAILFLLSFCPALILAQSTKNKAVSAGKSEVSKGKSSNTNPAGKTFSVQATISGLTENTAVSLSDVNNPADTVARARVRNGQILLTGSVQEPNLYYLNLGSAEKKTVMFLGNDSIQISGSVTALQNLKVTGSASHEDFMEFQQSMNPKFATLSSLAQKLNQGASDSLMARYNAQLAEINTSIGEFISRKKSSPVSPFLLLVTFQVMNDPGQVQARFSSLDEQVQQGFYGKLLQRELDKALVGTIGSSAIEFVQNDTTGKPVALSSFKGRYVLLDFWASWCRPCRMENPNVVNAYTKFKDKNFTVLGISLDKTKEAWLEAIREDQLTWTHVSDLKFWSNEVAQKYGIESIPQNFLLDPQGKIIAKNLRGAALQNKLCELLGCND